MSFKAEPAPGDNLLPVDWSLLPGNERILVAVSGGVDSMVLLWTQWQAKRDCIAVHVNHGLRGAHSDADEAFVSQHCATLGIPCITERLPQNAPHDEAGLRTARYEILQRLARQEGCQRIATGHNAGDQLETVLLNWLRGAAVAGMRGIEAQREIAPGLWLVRPLLMATREEIQRTCRSIGWSWREDASNQSEIYARNRVRHRLLPVLDELMQPAGNLERLSRQTARACSILQEEMNWIDGLTRQSREAITLRDEKGLLILDGLRFRAGAPALQRRILRDAVAYLEGAILDVSFERVEEVRRHIAENRRRAVWQWRRGLNIEWTGDAAGNRIRLWHVNERRNATL